MLRSVAGEFEAIHTIGGHRLEIAFRWDDVRQVWPVSPAVFKSFGVGGHDPSFFIKRSVVIGVGGGPASELR